MVSMSLILQHAYENVQRDLEKPGLTALLKQALEQQAAQLKRLIDQTDDEDLFVDGLRRRVVEA
jgi:hypothetical protein